MIWQDRYMRDNDGRKLDHRTLEVLRARAVEQVKAGAHPEDVALTLHRKTVYGCDVAPCATAPRRTTLSSWHRIFALSILDRSITMPPSLVLNRHRCGPAAHREDQLVAPRERVRGADVVVVLARHDEFRRSGVHETRCAGTHRWRHPAGHLAGNGVTEYGARPRIHGSSPLSDVREVSGGTRRR